MLVIICTKYGKNPSRTVDATERTRFSTPRPNDFEDIGQGQRSLYATPPLILVMICAKFGKNPSRTVHFFKVAAEISLKNCPKSKYGKNPSWNVDATGQTRKVNGQKGRQTDRQTERQTDRQTDRGTNVWADGRTDRQTDRQLRCRGIKMALWILKMLKSLMMS